MRKVLMFWAAVLVWAVVVSDAAPQTINVRGKVSTQAGKPIPNAIVTLVRQGLKDTTGSDGAYSITNNNSAVLPFLAPQSENISLNRGVLEFSLSNPSLVKVEIFNAKGNLLNKAVHQNAAAGAYHLNIAKYSHATNLLVIHASIGKRTMAFRYLSLQNGKYAANPSTQSFTAAGGKLAKIAPPVDSLKTTATNYTTKVTTISSYDAEVNVALDSAGCPHGLVKANEVLWIGDSWIEIPGSQHTTVRDLARKAGALGANEDYARKSVSGSTIATIINQYNTYQSGSTKVKALLMDGGGIDYMQGSSASTIADKFKNHLAKVASDGTVQHIIYYLYPELPTAPGKGVGPGLQPLMQSACAASAVPCHFLYLEPLFKGHPEYIGSDNLHPSEAGAKVIGNAVWDIMVKNCIAQ